MVMVMMVMMVMMLVSKVVLWQSDQDVDKSHNDENHTVLVKDRCCCGIFLTFC